MNGAERRPFSWRCCPRSIRILIIAYLACVAFAAANSILQFEFIRVRLTESVGLNELPSDGWVYAMIALRAGIALAILAWVLFRHSLIGRLIIGVQLAGWAYGAPAAVRLVASGRMTAAPFLLAGICSAIAVACLLLKSARLWFGRKGNTLADDLDSFS